MLAIISFINMWLVASLSPAEEGGPLILVVLRIMAMRGRGTVTLLDIEDTSRDRFYILSHDEIAVSLMTYM